MAKNRLLLFSLVSALILGSSTAIAQDQKQESEPENEVNLGYRSLTFGENSDQARFQRYNDFSSGITIDLFRLVKKNQNYSIEFSGNNVGYRDQGFSASYNRFGKFKVSAEYDQIPLFYSNSTRTLYSTSPSGVLMLDDKIQKGVEAKTLTLANAVKNALPFDLRSNRNVFDLDLKYNSSPNFAYVFSYKDTRVTGSRPWGANFGFTLANQVAKPNDHETKDFSGGVELTKSQVYFSFGVDSSYFTNNISDLTWENPLRFADSAAGPSMGRQAVWPNTLSNTVHTSGSLKLPGRSNATAYVSFGQLSNNASLIPFTINSALPAIPLDRPTADVIVNVLAMNYAFTSRPTNWLFVNAKYRQHNFDNKTDPFEVGQSVNYDTTLTNLNGETRPLSYSRHNFSTEVSLSPFSHLGFRTGFRQEKNHRTHSIVEESTENTGLFSVDLTGVNWLSFRGVMEHSNRVGSEIDREELLEGGFQPSVRMFDISDRVKDRYSLMMTVVPVPWLSLNGSTSIGKEDYPATDTRTVFGLRSNDNSSYSVGFDFVPMDKINFNASYSFDKYKAFQVSRTASPLPAGGSLTDLAQQFNDPRRDWSNNINDYSEMWQGSVGLVRLLPNTDLNFGYSDMYSKSTYVYSLAPNTVIAAPVQLPPVTNRLTQKTFDSRYYASRHVVIGFIYRYDQYSVNDFAFNPRNSLAEPATAATQNWLMLGYFQRPYQAHVAIGQFTYRW